MRCIFVCSLDPRNRPFQSISVSVREPRSRLEFCLLFIEFNSFRLPPSHQSRLQHRLHTPCNDTDLPPERLHFSAHMRPPADT